MSKEEILFFRQGYDFLLDPQGWREVKYPLSKSLSRLFNEKRLYLANSILFVQRDLSSYRVQDGLPKKLYKLSRQRFRNVKVEKPIGFKLTGKGKEGFLYHLYSEGIPLDKINKKTPQDVRKELVRLLADSTRAIHKNDILYYDPLSVPWLENELTADIKYDWGRKITYSPHQLMRFGKVTSDERTRELACLLYHFDWIDRKETIKFLASYYGKEMSTDEIGKCIENIRKKAVKIYGVGLKEHGIFYLTEEEKKIVQVDREHIKSIENRIMREIRDNRKKKMLEDYLEGR